MGASKLIGGSAGELEGTFAWKNSDTKPTETGEQDVTFTPTIDPNYKPYEGKVTVKVLSTTKSSEETKEPAKPVEPDPIEPEEPETPSYKEPVVAERTPTTAVITWDKVEGATSYTLFLYAKKGSADIPGW